MAPNDNQNRAISTPNPFWNKLADECLRYAKELGLIISAALWYLLVVLVFLSVFIIFYIIRRFLSIKFGKRIKPDGRRCVLITGATSGIGLLLAKQFYKLGFTVIAGYFNDQEPGYGELLNLSAEPFNKVCLKRQSNFQQNPFLFLIKMDVRSQDSIKASSDEIDAILDKHDLQLYALINNAGISREGPFEWLSRDSLTDIITTNLTGVLLVTRQFIKRIIMSKGRVVNVSSGIFLFPMPSVGPYGATKSGVTYFSDALNEDLKEYGASCCCIMPGNFLTTSNIIYSRIRSLQESVNALSEEERILYAKSIERHGKNMYRLLELRLDTTDEDRNQLAALHKIQIPDFSSVSYKPNKSNRPGLFARCFNFVMGLLDGGSGSKTLADSGVVNAYVDAVCLKSPPSNLFAGDSFYSHFAGPMVNLIPRFMTHSIGKLLMRNLVKSSGN